MSKVGLIIKREYGTRVKKKSFIIMTLLVPILAVGFLIAAVYFGMPKDKDLNILVHDDTYEVSKYFGRKAAIDDSLRPQFDDNSAYADPEAHLNEKYKLTAFDVTGEKNYDDALAFFKESDKYDLLLYIPQTIYNMNGVGKVHYKESPNSKAERYLANMVNEALEYSKIVQSESGITPAEYASIKSRVKLHLIDINTMKDEQIGTKAYVGFVFGLLIYMFIFLYGVQVMRGVIEEKSNRIVEVIVSSVKPFELMMGKIVGIALVGLTQFALWIVIMFSVTAVTLPFLAKDLMDPSTQAEMVQNQQVSTEVASILSTNEPQQFIVQDNPALNAILYEILWGSLIGLFLFYFIGGYLLYGSLMAAIGAAVDSETDTQQFMLPVSLPLIFAYLIAIMGIEDPNGSAMVWCSEIPFTSPVVMLVRFSASGGSGIGWQLFLSMGLLIVTFIATTWLAGKIYRTGILMYGKKPSYKEIFKWLKY